MALISKKFQLVVTADVNHTKVINGSSKVTMKNDIKHRDELGKASLVISELGFIPNESMCGDCPDIVLPSVDDRQIGLEIVKYSTHRYEELEDALYKILDEYIRERLDKHSEKRYEITIYFMNVDMPTDINFKKAKSQIFDELDSLLLPQHPSIKRQYIESVFAMENPGVLHSFISHDTFVVYEPLNEKILLNCIRQKEKKLEGYKARAENSTIQEYYLVVFFPINEHAELRGYKLPESFGTEYNRIYLVDYFFTNRII